MMRRSFVDLATGKEWTVFAELSVISICQSGLDEPCVQAPTGMAREVAEFILKMTNADAREARP